MVDAGNIAMSKKTSVPLTSTWANKPSQHTVVSGSVEVVWSGQRENPKHTDLCPFSQMTDVIYVSGPSPSSQHQNYYNALSQWLSSTDRAYKPREQITKLSHMRSPLSVSLLMCVSFVLQTASELLCCWWMVRKASNLEHSGQFPSYSHNPDSRCPLWTSWLHSAIGKLWC